MAITLPSDVGQSINLTDLVGEARERYAAQRPNSEAAHHRALAVLPGGNTRSVLHFEPFPFRVVEGRGAELVDVDGFRYIDYCGNYTASLIGHRPARVRAAIEEVLDRGWALGSPHEAEIELAELLCARFPSMDAVRFTNSGTEANLLAIATALHHTGRRGVGVFDHGYHGGVLSFGDFGGPHHPLNAPHEFVVARFNDIDGLDELFSHELGCVIVEAVQGSGGCRPALPEFLHALRRRCSETGTLLILDEVMTSRLGPSGAQGLFGVMPDLMTLGKYVAGGLSFGAFGGRKDVLANFDPASGGRLTQAGTFNNNMLSINAAVATLRYELDDNELAEVNARGDRLQEQLSAAFGRAEAPMWVTGLGSMLCVHAKDARVLELYFHAMLDRGHFIARRGFMALSKLITDAHTDALVADTSAWLSDMQVSGLRTATP
jgi:glutamate-1-semialdehyde 2,1-aminomutase